MRIRIVLALGGLTMGVLAWACSSRVEGRGDGANPPPEDGGAKEDPIDRRIAACAVSKNAAIDCADRTTDRYLYRAGDAGPDSGPEPVPLPEQACTPGRRYDLGCAQDSHVAVHLAAGPAGEGYVLTSDGNGKGLRTYGPDGTIGETQGFIGRMDNAKLVANPNGKGAWVVGNVENTKANQVDQLAYFAAPETAPIFLEEGITTKTELAAAGRLPDGTLVLHAYETPAGASSGSMPFALTRAPSGSPTTRVSIEGKDFAVASPFGALFYRKIEDGVGWGLLGQPAKTATTKGFFDATAVFFMDAERPPAYLVTQAVLASKPHAYAIFFPQPDGNYARHVIRTSPTASSCTFAIEDNCQGSCTEETDAASSVELVQATDGKLYAAFLLEKKTYTTTASKVTVTANPLDPECIVFDICESGTVCRKQRVEKTKGDERLVIAEIDPMLPGLRERLRFKTRRSPGGGGLEGVSIRDGFVHALYRVDKSTMQLMVVRLDQ
jgi:hypothetical protein